MRVALVWRINLRDRSAQNIFSHKMRVLACFVKPLRMKTVANGDCLVKVEMISIEVMGAGQIRNRQSQNGTNLAGAISRTRR